LVIGKLLSDSDHIILCEYANPNRKLMNVNHLNASDALLPTRTFGTHLCNASEECGEKKQQTHCDGLSPKLVSRISMQNMATSTISTHSQKCMIICLQTC